MIHTGKLTKGYAIYLDLSTGKKLTDVAKFDDEKHYNEVIKAMRDSYASSPNKPQNYVEVGIKNIDNVIEDITFETLRARLFK